MFQCRGSKQVRADGNAQPSPRPKRFGQDVPGIATSVRMPARIVRRRRRVAAKRLVSRDLFRQQDRELRDVRVEMRRTYPGLQRGDSIE